MNIEMGKQQSNGLGLAGFIVSLVGLCGTGGLLCPIGLVLSLFALGKEPKGFAIAGVVLGLLGSCGFILALVFVPVVFAVLLAGVGLVGAGAAIGQMGGPAFEGQIEMGILSANVMQYTEQNQGRAPDELLAGTASVDGASGLRMDHWGNPYQYQVSEDRKKFWLYSMGEDGIPNTGDDIQCKVTEDRFGPKPGAMSVPTIPAPSEAPTESTEEPAGEPQPTDQSGGTTPDSPM